MYTALAGSMSSRIVLQFVHEIGQMLRFGRIDLPACLRHVTCDCFVTIVVSNEISVTEIMSGRRRWSVDVHLVDCGSDD